MFMERRDKILSSLQTKQSATVKELSRLCGVSEVTIRQDLMRMEEEGLLLRTRGGAVLSDRANRELTFSARDRMNAEAKRRIGALAASLVVSGDSIIVDASTTALYVVRALLRRQDLHDLTIITNGIQTALEFVSRPDITTLLIGGILRMTSISVVGAIGWEVLAKVNATKGFFGARGISLEEGLTDVNMLEANLKKAMVERCQEVIAVADGGKFGEVSLVSFAPIARVNRIITDGNAPREALDALRAHGVEVMIA